MKQRYKRVVDERNPLTGMWGQVFAGSQPDLNRYLWKRHFETLAGAPKPSLRQRRVLKRRFITKREED